MALRDSIRNIAPPWLLDFVGERLLYIGGLAFDAVEEWLHEGIKQRYPDHAAPDALPFIGNDRLIERGPAEPDASYKPRLRQAVDTWRFAGSGETLLKQLAAYFTGIGQPAMRLVSDSSVWHEYNWSNGTVVRTKVTPANWIWDALTGTRWWRGWVIIDSSGGPFVRFLWGSTGGKWGHRNAPWGCTATKAQIDDIRRVVLKWKPQNVHVPVIIVTFNASLFERTDTAPPNPNGNYDVGANRSTDALYWPGGI